MNSCPSVHEIYWVHTSKKVIPRGVGYGGPPSWVAQSVSCFFVLVFDQLDVVSYEEVVRLPAFKRKTLVLIGTSNLS